MLRGMWDLPRPGIEPVSSALAGGFSTTVPPGKPWVFFFFFLVSILFIYSLIFIISFLLLTLGFVCSSSSNSIRWSVRLFIRDFFLISLNSHLLL